MCFVCRHGVYMSTEVRIDSPASTFKFLFCVSHCCTINAGDWQCPRVTTLYQAIKCPEGHYKVPEHLFDQQCESRGYTCDEEKGYSCYCKPCIKAFEVDLFQYDADEEDFLETTLQFENGCDKV